jgi:FlaA1/EpsC-like NDP-sugar epimerase
VESIPEHCSPKPQRENRTRSDSCIGRPTSAAGRPRAARSRKRDTERDLAVHTNIVSKRILLTGAAGFIGSHAAEALLARGHHVIGLDNLNDYYDPARKRQNLSELGRNQHAARFEFVEGDIRNRELVRDIIARGCDAIVHLAAMAGGSRIRR